MRCGGKAVKCLTADEEPHVGAFLSLRDTDHPQQLHPSWVTSRWVMGCTNQYWCLQLRSNLWFSAMTPSTAQPHGNAAANATETVHVQFSIAVTSRKQADP